jgi:predicted NAD/FAD-dependent oxidoreductase
MSTITTDILIIGAGLAGLSAANDLQQAGHQVLVIDKGRGLGGRLAGRRIGDATFDHGAQFMTAREPRFRAAVADWIAAGVTEEWYSSYPGQPNGHPRYRGVPTMTAVAKHLAIGLDIMRATRVVTVSQQHVGWLANLDNGDRVNAKKLLITSPVPQALELLEGINIPADKQARLERIEYESCIAVMAILDGPTAIAAPGAIALEEGPIAWISDNLQKGVSKIPAVTIHGSGEYSAEHLDHNRMQIGQQLIDAAAQHLGDAQVIEYQVHGWRYSKPSNVDPDPCLLLSDSTALPPLAVAGDAFAGPRFEGAVQSGWAAARALMDTDG